MFGVLFNFPSRYLFAIGLAAYLELEVYSSHIPPWYPAGGTLDTVNALFSYPYGAITLYGSAFQPNSGFQKRA